MRCDITYIGETTFHRRFQRFGIKQADRLSHVHVLGKTGVGKSTLLQGLALQDLEAGRGFALIDPHGDMVERIAAAVPPSLAHRVRYLNAPDPTQPFGYNPLRRVRQDKMPLAASGLLETLKKLWPEAWGVRMEHVLRNSLYALIERDGSVLPDLLRLYADKTFRKQVILLHFERTMHGFVWGALWSGPAAGQPASLPPPSAPCSSPLRARLRAGSDRRLLGPLQ